MKKFLTLAIILVFASCQVSNNKKEESTTVKPEIVTVTFHVNGMSCTDCEKSVAKGVNELAGIVSVKASYTDSTTIVEYDKNKTTESEITGQIQKRGYEVKGKI